MLKEILLGIKDWMLESPALWATVPSAVTSAMVQSKTLGYERQPAFMMNGGVPFPSRLPKIKQFRQVPAKVELHEAKQAGDHLDFRILIDGRVYDFALVKTTDFPAETGRVQRVVRTPNHSRKYFFTDNAVFPDGSYGAGRMGTVWRGNIDIIRSSPSKLEFYIPDGQFKGKYHIRKLSDGWIIGRMKDAPLEWTERQAFTSDPRKLSLAYDNPDTIISQHKIDGANYKLVIGEKENVLISRRLGVDGQPINQADKIPQLKYQKIPGTKPGDILHVEVVADNASSSFTAGVLNSLPSNSRSTQCGVHPLTLYVWDMAGPGSYMERGKRMHLVARKSPKIDRRGIGYAKDRFLIKRLTNPKLIRVPESNLDTRECPRDFAERLKAEGKEGVVVKNREAKYYEDVWIKDKKVETLDLRIIGFVEGQGRNSGRLGALVVQDPKTKAISYCGTGFSDSLREKIWENRPMLEGGMVEVDAHELTHNGVARGPRFRGFHPESNITIVDEQGLQDYAEGAGISEYQVKSAAGWRKK